MGIYSNMLVFESSAKAKAMIETLNTKHDRPLNFDMRAKYPFYKLLVGSSLSFDLNEHNENSIRSTVSQYNKRNNCQIVCIKHDNVLETARIK